MQFYLPSKFTLNNAPKPTNNRVSLVVIEGGIYAVIKYSGRVTNKNFQTNSHLLTLKCSKYLRLVKRNPLIYLALKLIHGKGVKKKDRLKDKQNSMDFNIDLLVMSPSRAGSSHSSS